MGRTGLGVITARRFDAVLFDLDGVLVETAEVHAACWKHAFDAYLLGRAAGSGEPFVPFDARRDYRERVDGRPREEGVRSFLASRGIEAAGGIVHEIAGHKNDLFRRALAQEGVAPCPGAPAFVRHLRRQGLRLAVVSSSRNARAILEAAGLAPLFELRVDGETADALGLRGKPAPDLFLRAADALGVPPARAAVIEDAAAGVAAARAGGFGLVIGVAEAGREASLRAAGADLVVNDLGELTRARASGAR